MCVLTNLFLMEVVENFNVLFKGIKKIMLPTFKASSNLFLHLQL